MKALKAKTLYYILIIGFIVLLAAGTAGFYWAQISLTAKKAEVIKKETELVDAQKRTDQLLQLSRRFGEANTRLIDINQALPRSSQQGEILLDIKEAARQAGVDLPSIQFTGTASPTKPATNQATLKNDIYVLPISLKLSGSYNQLLDFLGRLETLNRYNSVTSLNMTKSLSAKDRLDITMTLVAYLKP